MSGLAKGGIAITSDSNIAIAGLKPSGVAVHGQTIWTASAAEQWQLVASAQSVPGTASATTTAIDTTGAHLIVVMVSGASTGTLSFTDNQANNWVTGKSSAGIYAVSALLYCINPLTSANHTFTISIALNATQWCYVMAFKGPASIVADQNSGISLQNIYAIQPGSITPAANNSLLITATADGVSGTRSVDSGFAIQTQLPVIGGQQFGGAVAYLAQSTAAAINPTWSWGSSALYASSTMLSFIPSP